MNRRRAIEAAAALGLMGGGLTLGIDSLHQKIQEDGASEIIPTPESIADDFREMGTSGRAGLGWGLAASGVALGLSGKNRELQDQLDDATYSLELQALESEAKDYQLEEKDALIEVLSESFDSRGELLKKVLFDYNSRFPDEDVLAIEDRPDDLDDDEEAA